MNIADQKFNEKVRQAYKEFVAPDTIWPINEKLAEVIRDYNPQSVFEFGAGIGKNLELLKPTIPHIGGCDVSESAVEQAHKLARYYLEVGDESFLKIVTNWDVVFTCSVLNHIPRIHEIIPEFKRIAKKAIVLAETQDTPNWNFFRHDYESYGFTKLDYEWVSTYGGARYHIYTWEKP